MIDGGRRAGRVGRGRERERETRGQQSGNGASERLPRWRRRESIDGVR